jgi:D-arabinose 1-dehydrogenase-like Zn-dependent alcohol dehydrogenase
VAERLLHPVPETLTDVEAALAEPLGVALHAFDLGHVHPGAGAGVFGCGPLGLLLVQLLRLQARLRSSPPTCSPTASRQPRSSGDACVLADELASMRSRGRFQAAATTALSTRLSPRSARADASSSSASPTTTAPPFVRRLRGARA